MDNDATDTPRFRNHSIPPADGLDGFRFEVRTPQGTYLLNRECHVSLEDKDGKGVSGQLAELNIGDGGSWFQLTFTHNGQARRPENGEKKKGKNEDNVPLLNLGNQSMSFEFTTDMSNAALRLMFGCECPPAEFGPIEHVEGCIFDPTTTVSVKELERLREMADKFARIEPVFHDTQHELERVKRENARLAAQLKRTLASHEIISGQLSKSINRTRQLAEELRAQQEKKNTVNLTTGKIVFHASPEQPYSRAAVEHEGDDLIIRVQKGMTL